MPSIQKITYDKVFSLKFVVQSIIWLCYWILIIIVVTIFFFIFSRNIINIWKNLFILIISLFFLQNRYYSPKHLIIRRIARPSIHWTTAQPPPFRLPIGYVCSQLLALPPLCLCLFALYESSWQSAAAGAATAAVSLMAAVLWTERGDDKEAREWRERQMALNVENEHEK